MMSRNQETKKPKGHWPAGKRRHPKMPARLKARIRRAVANPTIGGYPDPERELAPSLKSVAAAIGVSDRTLRRWLSGEDNPAPDHVARLEAWLAERE